MSKIEQLVDLCRTTMQRLENNSDIASALLQADHVFMLHGCSSLNDLLRPLSLSGDRGLLRSVVDRGDETATRQVVTRGAAKISLAQQLYHQGELHPPVGMTMEQNSQRQSAPVLPVGSDSSPHSQQIVQKLLDGVRQELKDEHEQRSKSSETLPFDIISAAEGKKRLQLPKTMTDGNQRSGIAADHGQQAYDSFSSITPESERTGWFDRHPLHKTAASSLLPKDSVKFISKNTLTSWAAPLPTDDGIKERNSLQPDKKRGGAVLVPHRSPSKAGEQGQTTVATVRKKISPFHADEPGSRNTDTLLEPESASADFSQQEAPSSQLEQLLQKWKLQGGSQTTRGKKDQTSEGQTNGSSAGSFPQGPSLSEERGELNTFDAEHQRHIDNDHDFSETLERVLQREIRRHGMEEP